MAQDLSSYFLKYFNESSFPHYERIFKRLDSLSESGISESRQQADTSFLEHGITFTVYGEGGG